MVFPRPIDGKRAVIGSSHFVFEDENCTIPEGKQELFDSLPKEYSHLYLAIEGKLAGVICIEDPLREEAEAVVNSLKRAGITKVVMMTGDSERTAAAIAKRVGVDEYYSEVLPEDKAGFIEKEKAAGRKVIMIGDGINDSPALLQRMSVLRSVMVLRSQERSLILQLVRMIFIRS